MSWRGFISICALVLGGMLLAGWLLRPPAAAPNRSVTLDADMRQTVAQVDAGFAARWRTNAVRPTAAAPDLLVARRLSLALTGSVPSLEEIRTFEAWPAAERIDRFTLHLLEDPRCSTYLAERYARALVGVEEGPFLVYRRRRFVSWLEDQLQQNRPYHQLVQQLITARGTWTSSPEANFITVTIEQGEEDSGPNEIKLAGRVARAFLGLRLDCVECHDDFLHDRWEQRNFHEMAAFFGPASSGLSGVRDEDKPYRYTYRRSDGEVDITPGVPFAEELLPVEGAARDRLAAWVTHPDNLAFARSAVNRAWAILFGQPLVAPVDEIPLEGPWPPGLQILAEDFVANHYDLRRLFRLIAATRVFRIGSQVTEGEAHVTPDQEEAWAAYPLTRLRPEQVAGALLQSASLETIDSDAHIFRRIARGSEEADFIRRFGDLGEDEFIAEGGTIPQRLVLMNGKLIQERTSDNIFMNAATRIAVLTQDDVIAVEAAYLAVMTRRPSDDEAAHFISQLEGLSGNARKNELQDLYWALLNSSEFSWGH